MKIVIFRTSSRFNMVRVGQWRKSATRLSEAVQNTARFRSIPNDTYTQFKNLEHRKEVQEYLKEVWHG